MSIKSIIRNLWKIIHQSLTLVFLILTVGVVGLYSLAILAPFIPPTYTVIPAVLGLLFPIVFGMYALVAIYWIVVRRWRVVLYLTIIFSISLPFVLNYFPINGVERTEPLQKDKKRLRVLSYNVNAFGFRRHSNSAPNPILRYIKTSEADIVCLQEALLVDNPKQGVTYKQLKDYLSELYPYIHKSYAQPTGGSMLILLSKYPIIDSERLPLSSRANGGMMYRLQMPEGETHVFNLHLESFRLKKRDGENYLQLLKERNTLGLKEAVQLKFAPTFEAHNKQANIIQTKIAQVGTERTIVCGDFNDTPLSYTRYKIATKLNDAFIEVGNGAGFSYKHWLFIVRIDHILSGAAFVPISSIVDSSISTSDHYPIQADLIYTSEPEQE